ncbi:response regulator [Shewanella algae]|nr:response regulator [Shewanella algae]MDL2195678.1 response regulator [Shewanella algae]
MPVKILIVEDNEFKRQRIFEVFTNDNHSLSVDECYSFTSAWKLISEGGYDLVILDMSLPTFDKSQSEPGGAFRVFGGKELARKMAKRGIDSKFIFVTQYKNFSDNISSYSFDSLKTELSKNYEGSCLGFIFYSNTQSDWKEELLLAVNMVAK